MRKLYSVLLLFFSIFIILPVISANDTMEVEADIYAFQEVVKIDVPDRIYLGNVTMGEKEYTNPTSDDKIYVNNTGNTNVTVTPELVNSDPIFNFLYLTKRLSGENYEYIQIGDFDLDIAQPSPGSVTKGYFYMRLDLRNYTGIIDSDLIGYKADVKFVAVAS